MGRGSPSFPWYPSDWERDVGVQSLTFEERGIWWEILQKMHHSEERGVMVLNGKPMTDEQIAHVIGCPVAKLKQKLSKILANGVANRRQNDGALLNRRMYRESLSAKELSVTRSEAGKQGGAAKHKQKPSKKGVPSSSSSLSSSLSEEKTLKKESSCAEPHPDLQGLELYSTDLKLNRAWESFKAASIIAYPGIDVLAQLREAHLWEVSNPTQRKKNRTKFLRSWFAREQDKGSRGNGHSRQSDPLLRLLDPTEKKQ
jgi:hypothetical protein